MQNLLTRIRSWWNEADALPRALAIGGLATFALLTYLLVQGNRDNPDYSPLYTNLSSGDAGDVVERLRSEHISYKLADGGSTILVARDDIYSVRLDLAKDGLPRAAGGGVGFEIFDRNTLMMSNFTQRVNYARALQGELSRTISQMPQVLQSRVHLVLPNNSVFSRDKRESSASVTLRMASGTRLSPRQISGISHLVATSVEGLTSDRVAILDGTGRLISFAPDDGEGGNGSRRLAVQNEHEQRMERRLINLLEQVAGPGHVTARVSVDMDLAQLQTTEENYDPDGAVVRSERKTTEQASKRSTDGGGVAGAPGNLPQVTAPQTPAADGKSSASSRSTSHVDYAIPKTIRRTQRQIGGVRRISVAVLLDSNTINSGMKPTAVATEGGTPDKPSFDLAQITEVVKRTVGFDAERGDEVEVLLVPFAQPEEFDEEVPALKEASTGWMTLPLGAGIGGLLLLAGILVVRRSRSAQSKEARSDETDEAEEDAELEDAPEAEEIQETVRALHDNLRPSVSESLRRESRKIAADNPKATAEIIRHWVAGDSVEEDGETKNEENDDVQLGAST